MNLEHFIHSVCTSIKEMASLGPTKAMSSQKTMVPYTQTVTITSPCPYTTAVSDNKHHIPPEGMSIVINPHTPPTLPWLQVRPGAQMSPSQAKGASKRVWSARPEGTRRDTRIAVNRSLSGDKSEESVLWASSQTVSLIN